MSKLIDIRLQLILEPHANLPWLIQEAVRGGVSCIQWRDKFFNDRDFYDQAVLIKAVCRELKVPLIINDRVDIALAIESDGLHLGQCDFPFEVARRILPSHMAIGVSAESFDDIKRAENWDLDYLAISPVFLTPTKKDTAPAFGLEGFKKARSMSKHRLVAIGGVNIHNAKELKNAGADGLAMVRAICRAESPYEAAKAFFL